MAVKKKKGFGHIKKQDQVMIIAGKDRGKVGKVLKVLLKSEQVIVEKANFIKKHQRARRMGQKGGIVEMEGPIHVSNVMLLCDKCNRPARVGSRFLQDGRKVRICRHCGEVVD